MNYANSAGSATNASNDGSGRNIVNTYYAKTEVDNLLEGKFSKYGGNIVGDLNVGDLRMEFASNRMGAYRGNLWVYSRQEGIILLGNSVSCQSYEDYSPVPMYASKYNTTSNRASKENFSDITDDEALNLLKIPPQHFDYIHGEKNQSGFIAEDVEPFFPEICAYQKDEKTGEEKIFGLDYSKFTPYIVKLLQTLYDKMATLEQEKEGLEERLRKVEDCLGI